LREVKERSNIKNQKGKLQACARAGGYQISKMNRGGHGLTPIDTEIRNTNFHHPGSKACPEGSRMGQIQKEKLATLSYITIICKEKIDFTACANELHTLHGCV
jgi:hypothetical protein